MNAYAGSPLQPFFLVIHARRCIVNSTCDSCTKENRGIDLYRMINGAECTGVVMSCHRHPGYYGNGLPRGLNNQHKTNTVVNTVAGILQVYQQMKSSLVELKTVIDQDVHRNRENNRLYATDDDDDDDDNDDDVDDDDNEGEEEDEEDGGANKRKGKKKKKRYHEKEAERKEDENEPVILEAEYDNDRNNE